MLKMQCEYHSLKIQESELHKGMLGKQKVVWSTQKEGLLRLAGFLFSLVSQIQLLLASPTATILIFSHIYFHNKLLAHSLTTSNPSSTLRSQPSSCNANLNMFQTFLPFKLSPRLLDITEALLLGIVPLTLISAYLSGLRVCYTMGLESKGPAVATQNYI